MSIFLDILKDTQHLIKRAEGLEAAVDLDSKTPTSPNLGSPDNIKRFYTRRIISRLIWDTYAAAAIAHYRALGNTALPLLKEKGLVSDTLPPHFATALEKAYFKCDVTPWKDVRPEGYSYNPFMNAEKIDETQRLRSIE